MIMQVSHHMRSGSRVVISTARAIIRSRAGPAAAADVSGLSESDPELPEQATKEKSRASTTTGANRDLVLWSVDFFNCEYIVSPRTRYEWH